MADNRKSFMHDTGRRTAAGETIYGDSSTGTEYREDQFGNLHEVFNVSYSGGTSYSHDPALGKSYIMIIMCVLTGVFVTYIRIHMPIYLKYIVFKILPIPCIILPFVNETFKKHYRLCNGLLCMSMILYIFPKIDRLLGSGNNASFILDTFIFFAINAAVSWGFIFVLFCFLRIIQKKFNIGANRGFF